MIPAVDLDAPPWLIDFLEGVSVWDALLFVVGAAALVWFVRAKGWRGLIAFAQGVINSAKILTAVQGLPDWQDRIEQKIDSIHHEVNYNNGSSVKDSQMRTEAAVERIEKSIDEEVKPALTRLAQADDELWAAFDDTQQPEGDDND